MIVGFLYVFCFQLAQPFTDCVKIGDNISNGGTALPCWWLVGVRVITNMALLGSACMGIVKL